MIPMILCVAHRAYRRATGSLESPKGQLPLSVVVPVPIGGEPTARRPATREVFSGSACTLTHG